MALLIEWSDKNKILRAKNPASASFSREEMWHVFVISKVTYASNLNTSHVCKKMSRLLALAALHNLLFFYDIVGKR